MLDDDHEAAPAPSHVPAAAALPPPALHQGPPAAAAPAAVAPAALAAVAAHAVPDAPIVPAPGAAQPPLGQDTTALAASVHALTAMVQQLMQAEAVGQAAVALASAPAA